MNCVIVSRTIFTFLLKLQGHYSPSKRVLPCGGWRDTAPSRKEVGMGLCSFMAWRITGQETQCMLLVGKVSPAWRLREPQDSLRFFFHTSHYLGRDQPSESTSLAAGGRSSRDRSAPLEREHPALVLRVPRTDLDLARCGQTVNLYSVSESLFVVTPAFFSLVKRGLPLLEMSIDNILTQQIILCCEELSKS